MSKHKKYVPKHRHVPERPARSRSIPTLPSGRTLRSAAAMSSAAVAVTGIAVGGGLLGGTVGVGSAAGDIGTPVSTTRAAATSADAEIARDRGEVVSRTSDRRGETDPAQEAALAAGTGPAITGSVDLADGDPRDIARALMGEFGFGSDQFGCLDSLWTRESNWNPAAHNPSSGAHGIPQSLPGSKMASVGPDWATNPVTQITWGLGYIQDRYGSPCAAWGHSQARGWY